MFLTKSSGFGNGRALAQLKPSDTMVEPKVRKVFPDTALWLADVRTDSRGRATAELTFPDSLTTWRATGRGITADTRVGSTIHRVSGLKNLLGRLAVPQVLPYGKAGTGAALLRRSPSPTALRAGGLVSGYHTDLIHRRRSFWRTRISDALSVRMHGTDHVEFSAKHYCG